MTKNDIVHKNISLTFDFIRYLIAHSEILDAIPDGSDIEFLEFDFPLHLSGDVSDNSRSPVLFKVDHVFSHIVHKDVVVEHS